MELAFDRLDSPIGAIAVVARDGALCALDFDDCTERMQSILQRRFGSVTLRKESDPCGFTTRVGAYMNGALDALDDIEVDTGGTAFQRDGRLGKRDPGDRDQHDKKGTHGALPLIPVYGA